MVVIKRRLLFVSCDYRTAPFEKEKQVKLGARIRKIRMFRNITQKELGRRLGYGESSADVRIAQYESGQRTPKQETLIRIAEILEVDVRNFLSPGIATMDELMETLFWMDGKKAETGRWKNYRRGISGMETALARG